MEFAIRSTRGGLVCDPSWHCVADVIMPSHGFKVQRLRGTLLFRESPTDEWKEWTHDVSECT